jgi:hypothetical protein
LGENEKPGKMGVSLQHEVTRKEDGGGGGGASGFVGGEVGSAASRKVPNEVPHQLSTMN